MEVDKIQTTGCKFPRVGNGRDNCNVGQNGEAKYPDDEDDGEVKRRGEIGGGLEIGGGIGIGRFSGWPTSWIVRVSRASSGKDRHSKVLTSKGLRDRHICLSVTTAIQFYDLQIVWATTSPARPASGCLRQPQSPLTSFIPSTLRSPTRLSN